MLGIAQSLMAHVPGSGARCNAKLSKQDRAKDFFHLIPDDLLSSVITLLDVKGLLCLQQCDKRLQRLAGSEKVWRQVFMGRFGLPSKNQETAHKLAGSWQALYKSKVVTDQAAGQWRKPCPHELQAALHTMIHTPPRAAAAAAAVNNTGSTDTSSTPQPASPATAAAALESTAADADAEGAGSSAGSSSTTAAAAAGGGRVALDGGDSPARQSSSSSSSEGSPSLSSSNSIDSGMLNNEGEVEGKTRLSIIFLLDSSGSVGDEDFTCMTDFLETAAQAVADVDNCKVCVAQFSNDTRVEVPLGPLDKPAFDTAIKAMVRLNGGTNIAAAVAKAGSLLKADEASHARDMRRVLVLLTDGRIDSYQAREAASMVSRLSDEQSHVGLWAFGVGRGVDSAELMRIIEGPGESCKGLGHEQYMDLCVRDDVPW